MRAADVMERVVTELVAAIEAGAPTWEMPWRTLAATGIPTNHVTGNRYQGGNALWLAVTAWQHGYPSARWATFKQWQSIGARVRKGERGTHGIYWHTQPATATATGDEQATGDRSDDASDDTTDSVGRERVAWARGFVVFNAAQVDNPPPDPAAVELARLQRIERAEAFFAAVPAEVAWGTGNPCYMPAADRVVMPSFDAFHTAELAYGTLAHELGHWTGHPTRLNRVYGARFGDNAYAAEELVAELSAAFTCAGLRIDTATRSDHTAYLAHWCQMLRARPSTLWTVASKAQAAADFLAAFHADPSAAAIGEAA